jgi:hypothetical protein
MAQAKPETITPRRDSRPSFLELSRPSLIDFSLGVLMIASGLAAYVWLILEVGR